MSTDKFMSHFRMPKSEINKIRKSYQISKSASENIDPKKFKNFEELGNEVFKIFEEISGKKVNRTIMLGHLSHYFDEGFEVEEMRLYMLAQKKETYFLENPERFTIAVLFPVQDQDRMNTAWDHLAFHQAAIHHQEKGFDEAMKEVNIRLSCGHEQSVFDFKAGKICGAEDCRDSLLLCLESPYEAMARVTNDGLREFCFHFMRQNAESLESYTVRTYEKRVEVMIALGLKPPKLESLVGLLLKA